MEDPLPVLTIREITALELAALMRAQNDLVLLDVREPYEVVRSKINDSRVVYAPMSELARKQTGALPPEVADPSVNLIVFCHVGQRSAQVTYWLQELGWHNVASLAGGIDAYARLVNPEIGFY
jgi:rhodanese-related sulfurtransferase